MELILIIDHAQMLLKIKDLVDLFVYLLIYLSGAIWRRTDPMEQGNLS